LKRGSEVPAPTPILFHFPHGSCSPISLPQRRPSVPVGDNHFARNQDHKQKNVIGPQKKNKKKAKKAKSKK
jgi:hypothetical protein